jgi:uncharacterized protein (TIGR02246 family)
MQSLPALQEADQQAINDIISGYTTSWNERAGIGFGDAFADDADFVNIFGMHFVGKGEIESRHEQILQTIFKGSKLEIVNTRLREVQPGVIIALVRWKLQWYPNDKEETMEGIFTQVFTEKDSQWVITASQNTLKRY